MSPRARRARSDWIGRGHGFGAHPYGPNAAIVDERKHGQVGGTYHDDE